MFITINSHLRILLHPISCGILCFQFPLVQDRLKFFFLLISPLTHWLFKNVLFNFHTFSSVFPVTHFYFYTTVVRKVLDISQVFLKELLPPESLTWILLLQKWPKINKRKTHIRIIGSMCIFDSTSRLWMSCWQSLGRREESCWL